MNLRRLALCARSLDTLLPRSISTKDSKMRPSLAVLSKASRLPLNSKKANKDFYKGTRTGNIMVRKRLPVANRNTGEQLYDDAGNPRTWNVKTARIDEARVPSYIVPPGIAQCRVR